MSDAYDNCEAALEASAAVEQLQEKLNGLVEYYVGIIEQSVNKQLRAEQLLIGILEVAAAKKINLGEVTEAANEWRSRFALDQRKARAYEFIKDQYKQRGDDSVYDPIGRCLVKQQAPVKSSLVTCQTPLQAIETWMGETSFRRPNKEADEDQEATTATD